MILSHFMSHHISKKHAVFVKQMRRAGEWQNCTYSLQFHDVESCRIAKRRLKFWVLCGLSCPDRDQHHKLKKTVDEWAIPSDELMESRQIAELDAHREETDCEGKKRGKKQTCGYMKRTCGYMKQTCGYMK